jgi:hypothetical protein
LHDGVVKSLLTDLHNKLIKNELGYVMSQYINSSQSGLVQPNNQGNHLMQGGGNYQLSGSQMMQLQSSNSLQSNIG